MTAPVILVLAYVDPKHISSRNVFVAVKFENINQTTFSVVVGEEQSIAIKYKESNKALILLKMEEQQLNISKTSLYVLNISGKAG